MKLKRLTKRVTALTAVATAAIALTACGSSDEDTIKLGLVGAIYEEVWAPVQEELAKEGINIEFVQLSDYVTPNKFLNEGEIDLNAFQHRVFLEADSEANGYEIENIGNTFIIPLNLYSKNITSVDEIQDGDKIAIPDDVTNGGRALKVLEAAGLIALAEEAEFNPTLEDITEYFVAIEITELAANTIPSALEDLTAGIINGNFALDFGLDTREAIFTDTVLDEVAYWNLIAARSSDLEDEEVLATYKRIVEVYQSSVTHEVFEEIFYGYFVPQGWDEDLFQK